MVHPLIEQLRFARSEFVRGLADVSEDEGIQRFGPMNSISWTIGHLADQEQRYWFQRRALALPSPGLNDLVGHGKPAPDLFLLAAGRLGVEPERCLVFEDAPAGVAAGKAAGMEVVWIPNDHTRDVPMPVAPDWRAESLFEAMNVLEARRTGN